MALLPPGKEGKKATLNIWGNGPSPKAFSPASPLLRMQQRPKEPTGTPASWVRIQSSSGKLARADHKLCSARLRSSLRKTWSSCNNSFSTPCCAHATLSPSPQAPPFAPWQLPNPIYLAFLGSPRLGELRELRILQEVPQSRAVEVACTWGPCLEVVGKYLKKTTPDWCFGPQTMGESSQAQQHISWGQEQR